MDNGTLQMGTLLAVGMVVLGILAARQWRHPQRWRRLAAIVLVWAYTMALVRMMFIPVLIPEDWPAGVSLENALAELARVNFVPFHFGNLFSASPRVVFAELAGNLVLAAPYGLALAYFERPSTRRNAWLLIAGLWPEMIQLAMGFWPLKKLPGIRWM